jgi:hypothetical protein
MARFPHASFGIRNSSRFSGCLGAALMGHEHQQGDEPCGEDPEGAGIEPSDLFGADDAVGQQPCRTGDECDADDGRDPSLRVGRLMQVSASGHHRVHPDGEVDEERPPPPEALDDCRTEGGAERAGHCAGDTPDRYRSRELIVRERVHDQRQGRRDEGGGAGGLEDAEPDEDLGGRRQPAGHGRHREHRRPRQEDAPVTDPVGELPGRDEQGGEDDRVRVQHPGELCRTGVGEGDADVGERHVEDGRVEERRERGEGRDRERAAGVGEHEEVSPSS